MNEDVEVSQTNGIGAIGWGAIGVAVVIGAAILIRSLRGGRAPGETRPSVVSPTVTGPFSMTVEDVFSIAGRGTVVTGKVKSGRISKGDNAQLHHAGQSRQVKVTGVEMFRKTTDTAVEGDNVGLLLDGVERNEVSIGDLLSNG